ncbi:MAG: NHL repeat-containing protein, partial [Planctomycetota bacterium]
SKPTDVAVCVLDAKGNVVRHLVAGVIGGKGTPPAPLKAGLSQQVEWDGKDDVGKPAAGGPFKVRVRAGTKPEFDRFLLFEPDAFPSASSVAPDGKGNVYVFYRDTTANGNQGGHKIRIIDRGGKFVRQILPFPADAPHEKVKAAGTFKDEQGRLVPYCRNWHRLEFYPDTIPSRGRSMSDFSQPVIDGKGTLYWIKNGGRLCAVNADGTLPYADFLGPKLFPGLKHPAGRPALCLSGDGKFLYASGIFDGRWGKGKWLPCVYRIDIATRKCEVFIGDPGTSGKEKDRFTRPRGVAVAKGLLYVADPEAGRVAVFKEADKSFVGEIKCRAPHIVQVHPETGEVYVVSYDPVVGKKGLPRTKNADLLKFKSWKESAPAVKMALPKTGLSPNGGTHRVALDAGAKPPLIWVPALPYGAGNSRRLSCYRDAGGKFEPVEIKAPKGPWGQGPRDMLVDRKRGDFYVKTSGEQWHQFSDADGEYARLVRFPKNSGAPYSGAHGANLGVTASGDYITHCWGKGRGMMRWSRDLKPLNWDGMGSHKTEWGGMMTFQLNYLTMRGDDIYLIKRVDGPHSLDIYDLGLKQKRRVIWNARRGSCPRVDPKGNVYITVPIRPLDRDFQKFFDGKLGKIPDYFGGIGNGAPYWYTYMAGAIVKFPPEGGAFYWTGDKRAGHDISGLPAAIAAKPKVKYQYFIQGHYPHKTCEVQNALWARLDYAPYSETYGAGTPVCMCEGAGFDVDGFGRVWYPNLFRFRVEMVDTNNNFGLHFGAYGNQDSLGGGKSIPRESESAAGAKHPDVPLAWPTYVAVSDDYAYVNDTVGMRVARVKLGAEAEETCAVR